MSTTKEFSNNEKRLGRLINKSVFRLLGQNF